jgi:lysophospholipase L1-like esterase
VVVALHRERGELEGDEPEGLTRQRALAEEAGAAVVSMRGAFASALERGEEPYRDRVHPTALGQRLIADALREPLLAALRGS